MPHSGHSSPDEISFEEEEKFQENEEEASDITEGKIKMEEIPALRKMSDEEIRFQVEKPKEENRTSWDRIVQDEDENTREYIVIQ